MRFERMGTGRLGLISNSIITKQIAVSDGDISTGFKRVQGIRQFSRNNNKKKLYRM